MSHPNLINLETQPPKVYDGGTVRGVSATQFPILTGQNGAMYSVKLVPGGVREPHWHPNAWEFDYCVSGLGRMTVLGTDGTAVDTFDVAPGDAVFVPQGYFHYFENIGADEFHLVIVFNSSLGESDDDIGIADSLSAIPDAVLAATFGTSPEKFAAIPKFTEPVVIARKPLPGK